MNCCLQKYTTYQFTYMLYIIYFKTNSKIQNYQNPTNTSKDTYSYKTILLFYLHCFLLVIHWNLKQLKKRD